MPSHRLSRRSFMAGTAATVAAAPFVKAYAADEPKEKVRLAVIGVADRGSRNLAEVETEEIVALCEVDEPRADAARKQFPKAKFFTDYRKMFDKVGKEFDGVVISTPDHTHAFPTLLAMKLGKHVYCEKPLARSIEEVRAVRDAAAKSKVVTQMGTQIHAGDNYRRVVEIVRSGQLGNIRTVRVWCARQPDPMKKIKEPKSKVKFDLDLWLGPCPEEFFYASGPSTKSWPHFDWRWWWPFGGGVLADMGCHFMDLAFWALELGAPTSVKADGVPQTDCDNSTVPAMLRVEYKFPATQDRGPVTLFWYHGASGPDLTGETTYEGFPNGVLFDGELGTLVSDYSKYKVYPDSFSQDFRPPLRSLAKSVGHHREWLDAILGKTKSLCDFGYSGNLTEAVLLGNVAYRAGKPITWDAEAMKVTDVKDANQYVQAAIRKGWELPK